MKVKRRVLGASLIIFALLAIVFLFGFKQVEWCDDTAGVTTGECHSSWQWNLW